MEPHDFRHARCARRTRLLSPSFRPPQRPSCLRAPRRTSSPLPPAPNQRPSGTRLAVPQRGKHALRDERPPSGAVQGRTRPRPAPRAKQLRLRHGEPPPLRHFAGIDTSATDLLPSRPHRENRRKRGKRQAHRHTRTPPGTQRRRPQGAALQPVRHDAQNHPQQAGRDESALPLAHRCQHGSRRHRQSLPRRRQGQRLPAFPQSWRQRPQSHRRVLRHPLRPLVEPRCGEPGHRPCSPHRPDAARHGLPHAHQEHHRGEDHDLAAQEEPHGQQRPRRRRLHQPPPARRLRVPLRH